MLADGRADTGVLCQFGVYSVYAISLVSYLLRPLVNLFLVFHLMAQLRL